MATKTTQKKQVKKTTKPSIKAEKAKKTAKTYVGVVMQNKAAKTLRVRVETKMAHPLYKKIIKRHKNYLIHSNEEVGIGARVTFKESRPISTSKKWVLVKVLGEAK